MKQDSYHFFDNRNGFTIIETMVVLAIIVIMAGIAIPAFITILPNYRLKSAAQDLYSNLQAAKMDAIKKNGTSTLTFYPGSGTYVKADGSTVNLNEEYEGSVSYGRPDSGANVTYSPDPKVMFNSRGMTDTGQGAVFFKNEKDNYYKVETYTTGVIVLKKWNGSAWE